MTNQLIMRTDFVKMHGAGNDYIYIDCTRNPAPMQPEELAIKLSDRHKGIGGDGLVLILPSETATCRMRMFNADGSEGRMCGNAIRCVGKYVYEAGLTRDREITVETLSGVKRLRLFGEGGHISEAEVDMGKAETAPERIPMMRERPFIAQEIEAGGERYRGTAISMGNPHLVIETGDTEAIDIERIGPLFERHRLFPERVNTEFAQQTDSHTIKMRVWERGSGETMACGTGACATVAAFALTGKVEYDTPVTVLLRGGSLTITCRRDMSVLMRGEAVEVFRGTIDI